MVVIGKEGPRLKLPAIVDGERQQLILKQRQPIGAAKVVGFLVRAGSDHVRPGCVQAMRGGVGPIGHGGLRLRDAWSKSGGKRPHSKEAGVSRQAMMGPVSSGHTQKTAITC